MADFEFPEHPQSEFGEYPTALAARMASKFQVPAPLEAFDFPEKGNINRHTYLIVGGTPGDSSDFLLQQINQQVFREPRKVMASMIACIESQRRNLPRVAGQTGAVWETIELIPTRDGSLYLEFHTLRGVSYWRLMKRISQCRSYKSLSEIPSRAEQLKVAREAGKGLALHADLTADMDVSLLENPLPGYRNTRLYYSQLDSVLSGAADEEAAEPWLPKEPVLRGSTGEHFRLHLPQKEFQRRLALPEVQEGVQLALSSRTRAMSLLELMERGTIRTVGIHGDTKLDNFLFSTQTGQVVSLVDLDTIMPHTWLADWGDMVRSLVNVAGERERDGAKIGVDREIFEALAAGFLSTSRSVLPSETSLMVEAVQIIALELGVRFLTDFLRGDSYFRLGQTDPPDLNKVRGLGQLTLYRRLLDEEAELKQCIDKLLARRKTQGEEPPADA